MIITNTVSARPSKQEDLRAWRTCLLLSYEMWWKGPSSVTKTPLNCKWLNGKYHKHFEHKYWGQKYRIHKNDNKSRFGESLPPISPSQEATQSSPTLIRGREELNGHLASIILHLIIISCYLCFINLTRHHPIYHHYIILLAWMLKCWNSQVGCRAKLFTTRGSRS